MRGVAGAACVAEGTAASGPLCDSCLLCLWSQLAQLQRSQQTQRRAGPAPRQAVVAVNGGRARAARPMAAAQGAYPVAMAYGNGAGYGRAASAPAGMKRAKAPNNLKITVPNDARMGPQGRRTRM